MRWEPRGWAWGLGNVLAALLAALILAACAAPHEQAAGGGPRLLTGPHGVELALERVAGADMPAAFTVTEQGRLYVGELATGRILLDGREVANLAVSTGGESGLESLASDGTWLFAYLSVPESDPAAPAADGGPAGQSRVLRFVMGPQGDLGQPETLLSVPGAGVHNAGSVAVGPDGLLYVDIGDNIRRGAAQDLSSPFGKILRLTPDGTPAAGNPFADRPDADARVWVWGIRNTFAVTWLRDGRMVGADNGERAGDEINLLRAGANYGWPPEQSPAAAPPVLTWSDTFAPAGLIAVPPGWGSWSDAATLLACGVVPGRMDLIDLDRPDREPVPVLDGCTFNLASDRRGGLLFSTPDAVWRLAPADAPAVWPSPTVRAL
jgi:glucose/arabinose dehydrogenase